MSDDSVEVVKQPEELLAEGGIFYTIGEESWCDLPTESWVLVPGKGYVRKEDSSARDHD